MSLVRRSSEGVQRREARNRIGPPPWSKAERAMILNRVRVAVASRRTKLGLGATGPLSDFLGYDGAALFEHLERRHAQGCLVCGNDIAEHERFEICHVDPVGLAFDADTLAALMQLSNLGLAHVACNVRLGSRPIE